MKAERIHSFGGPEVLRLEELPQPEPGRGELRVRVHAAGVNPVDWKIRQGYLGQFPLPSIMGIDFSGVVEALGPDVETFRVGEAAFGSVADESGSYAEYAIAHVSSVAEKPPDLDHLQAAALPTAGLTAWQALFDKANLQTGQRVLIHAAAGGVGGFAVQFAKWKGAYVFGTASNHHVDYLRSLGADQVIDYRATRFEEAVKDVDMVFDTVGGDTQKRSWQVLKPGGILVSIVQPPPADAASARNVRGVFLRCDHARGDQLTRIAELVLAGKVKVDVQTILPLEQARQAQELSQKGHTQGKIVLRVAA
jgi:NADPH:quinone reductase-like Zn-dependent oxidoreductase